MADDFEILTDDGKWLDENVSARCAIAFMNPCFLIPCSYTLSDIADMLACQCLVAKCISQDEFSALQFQEMMRGELKRRREEQKPS